MSEARGPVTRGERTLAPDLARGAMLLFIALANAAGVALGGPGFAPHPLGLERWVTSRCCRSRAPGPTPYSP